MKSAVFERQQGNIDVALSLLEDGLKSYPKFGKLYMIKGQILQAQKKYDEARATFAAGTKACPKEIPLWILASRLEEEAGRRVMARSLLNKARALTSMSRCCGWKACNSKRGTVRCPRPRFFYPKVRSCGLSAAGY
jgi:tetratricopeptide (TPR) repeat protein